MRKKATACACTNRACSSNRQGLGRRTGTATRTWYVVRVDTRDATRAITFTGTYLPNSTHALTVCATHPNPYRFRWTLTGS